MPLRAAECTPGDSGSRLNNRKQIEHKHVFFSLLPDTRCNMTIYHGVHNFPAKVDTLKLQVRINLFCPKLLLLVYFITSTRQLLYHLMLSENKSNKLLSCLTSENYKSSHLSLHFIIMYFFCSPRDFF